MKKYEVWQEMMAEAYMLKLESLFKKMAKEVHTCLDEGNARETAEEIITCYWDETYSDYENFLMASGLWEDGNDLEDGTLRARIYHKMETVFEITESLISHRYKGKQ